jgi:hypothetical protein
MRKDAADPSRSTPDSESGRKKKYNAPQFTRLTPEEAKAHADSEGLAGESRRETLLEWIAELEMRPTKSDPTQEPQRPKAAWLKSSRVPKAATVERSYGRYSVLILASRILIGRSRLF